MTSESTTESDLPRTLGAVMSAEAGYEGDEKEAPLRITGYLCLILALLGGFGIVAAPMVWFSVAAIVFGVFALRKTDSDATPAGTGAAKIGLCLAMLFGSWGIAGPLFKQNTLGSQAEYFAKEYLKVAGGGDYAYTMQLERDYINRFPLTVPLDEQYQKMRAEREAAILRAAATGDPPPGPLEEDGFGTVDLVRSFGPDHEWILNRPVRVFHRYGRLLASVVLASDRSKSPTKMMMELEYRVHKERDTGEWNVTLCQPYRERLVAESIL